MREPEERLRAQIVARALPAEMDERQRRLRVGVETQAREGAFGAMRCSQVPSSAR